MRNFLLNHNYRFKKKYSLKKEATDLKDRRKCYFSTIFSALKKNEQLLFFDTSSIAAETTKFYSWSKIGKKHEVKMNNKYQKLHVLGFLGYEEFISIQIY